MSNGNAVINGISRSPNSKIETNENLTSLELLQKIPVGDAETNVLKLCAETFEVRKFAVALSNYTVKVYDIHGKWWAEYELKNVITDMKFSSKDPSLLFVSSLDGKLYVWDTRCRGGPAQTFSDDSDGDLKPLTCFDVSSPEQLICAGTEVIREDSFLLFWDRRATGCLGGYWNSHSKDITQVRFHPYRVSNLASASVDGLINIFDLNENSEEDALMYTLNAGNPVNSFIWRWTNVFSLTTSTEEFQMWDITDVKPRYSVQRNSFHAFRVNVDYMIETFQSRDNTFLATGTNEGFVHLWTTSNTKVDLKGSVLQGHSDVVRTISFNDIDNLVTTGGDDGFLCYWRFKEPSIG